MKKIILITGGERSGKSSYAERLAHELSASPVYMATAKIWDEEFRRRVERHQQNRGPEWTNIEEEKELSRHDITGRVAEVQRRFTDLQGWMNQYIASKADQVVLMVCGIPVKVKG